ncbi:M48 family metallopeptidase [Spirochaeta lutea]|uniref:M48 family metallopeptidase n=1 Tax=Spirochaeta lutea TaxID=1480694 RepID=UPI0006901D05|nr:M48 family metallopeptidase [Spirochaeta lutea]
MNEFPSIDPKTWEHPADRAALNALRAVPGVNEVIRFVVGLTGESSLRQLFLASAVRVSPDQFPRVHALTIQACSTLDIHPVPEVYVTQNPVLNAGAVGVDRPFITLNSSLVQAMDDQELLCIIGHELGHIASNHVLYKTLLWLLVNSTALVLQLPVGQLALYAIIAALREWDRKSELTADRAGLLTVQDPNVQYRVLMKLAGGSEIGQMNIDSFLAQAADYDAAGTMVDSIHKVINLIGQTHPFPVIRVSELKTWIDSGSYQRILDGEYFQRDSTASASRTAGEDTANPGEQTSRPSRPSFEELRRDFEESSKAYQEELRRSKDPLAKAAADLGERLQKSASDAGKNLEDFFKKLQGR